MFKPGDKEYPLVEVKKVIQVSWDDVVLTLDLNRQEDRFGLNIGRTGVWFTRTLAMDLIDTLQTMLDE